MAEHRFEPSRYYNAIGTYEPALRVADGDTVITKTVDAWGSDDQGRKAAERGNPMTGPFYVDGAEPGDALAVTFDRLAPSRADGFTRGVLAPNVLDPAYLRELPPDFVLRWQIDVQQRLVTPLRAEDERDRPVVREALSQLHGLRLPLAPMLGCFGVAPGGGQAIATSTAGPHGGNMDYKRFGEGVTVFLPVAVPGALFFLGDGHAVQGDGEIVGTGVETSFEVQFTVRVRKGMAIGWPRGQNADYIFTAGNARPLDQALQHATSEMLRWLSAEFGLSPAAASIILGQCVEYEIGNVYDPAYTVVCKLRKNVLAQIGALPA